MTQPFTYQVSPMRVVFGVGTVAQLADELDRLGINRALVLASRRQQAELGDLADLTGGRVAGLFDGAVVHTPVAVTEHAMEIVRELKPDGVVAIGAGAATGLSKAIALRTDLPQLIVPTSYAGSEMTPVLGETVDGVKTTQSSPKILPETVIYDVNLTISMPAKFSAISGLNAIAHAAEALYARDGNPITWLMAEEAIAKLASSLPNVIARPRDLEARADALYGAWLCAVCLGTVGMALHHKLCHTVGALFDLPHAETHAVLLPHTIAYNTPAAREAIGRAANALGAASAADGLFDLSARLGAPRSLAEIGMPEDGIAKAAALATKNPYWNPRPIEESGIRDLLKRAWSGSRPQAE
ncbi:alcohol dehydrogenase class IV [Bradyrhizobium sp. USDA 4532]|uniref:maleylacetate reductase n=1 Tax=unclassified Bradyrhizobium TaxID=2631580 RepID=UPI00209D2606|nr:MULTISPECIES: maleylacetate reductase [unclassified Bradyrhizobium]MCP1830809.1 alcohol dehydrogenase class IV [Bradyrhizobium sp. USDA 4545]MCP1923918.1 alcohol dehydrogenase class IV [Bradyrhizobium sp. USDA 4532]